MNNIIHNNDDYDYDYEKKQTYYYYFPTLMNIKSLIEKSERNMQMRKIRVPLAKENSGR